MKSPFIRRVREARGRQRVANASALSAIALGVVGVLLGTGVATTAIGVSDGMTWLADSRTGEVLQYNPSTKRVERSYQVAQPGDEISVSQDSGIVALRNDRTGEVVTVDMSRLRAAGARAAGGPSKVLVAKGMMMLVDRDRGILRRIDPVKANDLGQTWRNAAPVADAVADQQGTVWVLAANGHLRALTWNDQAQRFDETSDTQIQRVTDDGLLAAHPTGVTVFGPRAGVIAQVGTTNDGYRQSNRLVGIAPQATEGPSDLVVGALASQSSVVIIDRGEIRQVSTAELGCVRPINPAAFNSRVYVVCQGNKKVIQLGRDGQVAGPEIVTPGSADAQPVADEGRLVLNVSGAREGIEIDRTGSDQRFDRTPDAVTQTMRAEASPGAEGLELGREQARADLVVEPLPDQPDSGSGNVETRPDEVEDRTEVVDGDNRASNEPSEQEPLPEVAIETPAAPTREPVPTTKAPAIETDAQPNPARETSAPVIGRASPSAAPSPAGSGPSPTPADSPSPPTVSAEGSRPFASTSGPVPKPTTTAPATTSSDRAITSSDRAITPSDPATKAPAVSATRPASKRAAITTTRPATRGPATTTSGRGTTAPATTAAEGSPARTASTSRGTAARTATPVSPAVVSTTVQPAGATTSATSLAAPARLAATANGSSVTVTWAHSGPADGYAVTVGGRTVQVVASARSATVTGNPAGTTKVTVTAVRGHTTRSAETSVTVGSPTTPALSSSASLGTKRTPSATDTSEVTPTRTQLAGPPAAPTGVRGAHLGTLATVRFNSVPGATGYTIFCDDYGSTTVTGTSGSVACGPDSLGRAVRLGVRANNAAGSSAVAEVLVDAS